MSNEVITFDKDGRPTPKLATIKIGCERLENYSSRMAGQGFVICREHGTAPMTWVRGARPTTLYKCCRLCVKAHCQLAMALPDGSDVDQVRT